MSSGYSSTPLLRKLGIKEKFQMILWNVTDNYLDLLGELPSGVSIRTSLPGPGADFIHLFIRSSAELEKQVGHHIKALNRNGMLWISWPKGSSGIDTDLKRDMIREYVLDIGLVDIKVAAVDDIWSGLKFMYRMKDR